MLNDDGGTTALLSGVQHLLRTLERKGLISSSETESMLDGCLEEISDLRSSAALSPAAAAIAQKVIGGLYLPIRKT